MVRDDALMNARKADHILYDDDNVLRLAMRAIDAFRDEHYGVVDGGCADRRTRAEFDKTPMKPSERMIYGLEVVKAEAQLLAALQLVDKALVRLFAFLPTRCSA